MEETLYNWAPLLSIDEAEPFEVLGVCARELGYSGPDRVLEYRVAWSADIGHAYDVETIHVRLGGGTTSGVRLRSLEASAHGSWVSLAIPENDARIQAFVEPGKHGFGARPQEFSLPKDVIEWFCCEAAGDGGVHRSALVVNAGLTREKILRSCASALRNRAFHPRWSFQTSVDLRMIPWLDSDAFDELVLTSIRRLAEEHDPEPLGIAVRDRIQDGGFWWGGRAAFADGQWRIGGTKADEIFRLARIHRTTVMVEVPSADAWSLHLLQAAAWPHYLTSRLILVCTLDEVTTVLGAGLVPAPRLGLDGSLPHALPDQDLIKWVTSSSEHQTQAFSGTAFVIGPGEADVILDI